MPTIVRKLTVLCALPAAMGSPVGAFTPAATNSPVGAPPAPPTALFHSLPWDIGDATWEEDRPQRRVLDTSSAECPARILMSGFERSQSGLGGLFVRTGQTQNGMPVYKQQTPALDDRYPNIYLFYYAGTRNSGSVHPSKRLEPERACRLHHAHSRPYMQPSLCSRPPVVRPQVDPRRDPQRELGRGRCHL